MIRFQFNQFKGTITQALIVIKSVQIDDFWTLDMPISTLDMSVSTLDVLLSTLDNYPDFSNYQINGVNRAIYEKRSTSVLHNTHLT